MMHRYFHVADGRIVKSVEELPRLFSVIPDHVFEHHVNDQRNDFSHWVYHTHGLEELSNRMQQAQNKIAMKRIVQAYLQHTLQAGTSYTFVKPKDAPIDKKPEESAQDKAQHPKIVLTPQIPQQPSILPSEQNPTKQPTPAVQPTTPQPQSDTSAENSAKQEDTAAAQNTATKGTDEIAKTKKTAEAKNEDHTTKSKPGTEADQYFAENPIIMDQHIKNKQKEFHDDKLGILGELPGSIPAQISTFKEYYQKTYDRLSQLRKKGFVTDLAQIMLERVPAKIKYLEASQDPKDAIVVKRYLNETIDELNMVLEDV